MRIQQIAQIVALVGVALTPVSGEASPITTESMMPSVAGAADAHERSGGTASADPWALPGFASLLDGSGDSILLLTSANAFDPTGGHDKLRGGRGGVFFSPTGGPSGGASWGGFGGHGSSGGGAGLPGFAFFTVLPWSTPGADPDLDLNLGFGIGSGVTVSFEQCCEGDTSAVPEPSILLLVGSGLAFGLTRSRRARRARSNAS